MSTQDSLLPIKLILLDRANSPPHRLKDFSPTKNKLRPY